MDKDRIVGSAKEFAGRAEGAVGDLAGDAQTQASGKAREAAGTVQNLYGQAKDAVRDADGHCGQLRQGRLRQAGRDLARRFAGDCPEGAGQPARLRCWSPAVSASHSRC